MFKKLLTLFGIIFVIILTTSPALAAEVTSSDPTMAVPGTVTLEPWLVAILIGTVTPLLTGFATKLSASPGKKAVVSLVLVALGTVANIIIKNNGSFVIRDIVVLFFTTLTAHMVSYFQLWEPIGTGGSTFTNQLTPNHGIS